MVKRFTEKDLICIYSLPAKLIIENAQNFNGKLKTELYIEWKLKHFNSSPYKPKMNGVVNVAYKNLQKIIQKMIVTYKDWHKMFSYALHVYRTITITSTGTIRYSLVYEMEVVIPLEIEIPSLRVQIDAELEELEWTKLKFK